MKVPCSSSSSSSSTTGILFGFLAALSLVQFIQAEFITSQQCYDQGGIVVGLGENSHHSGYTCENTKQPPTDKILQTTTHGGAVGGVAFAADAEVCCGGTGNGFHDDNLNDNNDDATSNNGFFSLLTGSNQLPQQLPQLQLETNNDTTATTTRINLTRTECLEEHDGMIQVVLQENADHDHDPQQTTTLYICESNGEPPIGNIVTFVTSTAIQQQQGTNTDKNLNAANTAATTKEGGGEVCCGPKPLRNVTNSTPSSSSSTTDTSSDDASTVPTGMGATTQAEAQKEEDEEEEDEQDSTIISTTTTATTTSSDLDNTDMDEEEEERTSTTTTTTSSNSQAPASRTLSLLCLLPVLSLVLS